MVGSIVITPTLIHEYSDYGEGNFNAVKEISSVSDGSWRVNVHVGIDSMPADDANLEVETHLLELKNERLSWEPQRTTGRGAHGYFKCGSVRNDLYQSEYKTVYGSKEFPAELRGQWMLGPEPCYLPLNSDADGQLTITHDKMYGYEDTYEPVQVSANPNTKNSWNIAIAEELGDQRYVSNSIFTLMGPELSIKYEEKYTAMYVKCVEKRDD